MMTDRNKKFDFLQKLLRFGRKNAALLALLITVFVALPASAKEVILSFDSTITVRQDASLLVVEKIRVRAEGRKIKRGIYRDFPVLYRDKGGYRRKVGFKVVSVTRDGAPEPWFEEASGDFSRVYIGSKDIYLPSNEYLYEITYETTRQLRYFDEYDELYWNVTGNNWAFPIEAVSARIELPETANIINNAAFTGRFGAQGNDYTARSVGQNIMEFKTTRPLNYFEGLTVAVGWPKGIVAEPSPLAAWFWRIWDNLGFIVMAIGTLGVATYFYVAWRWVGRDPEGGLIFPRFAPPEDMSPAAISYLHYMGFKLAGSGATKPFIAALVALAVKKFVVIDDTESDLIVKKGDTSGREKLPSGERALLRYLLGSRDELKFKRANYRSVQSARTKFKAALLKEHGDVYFKNNYGWFIAGAVASLAVITISLLLTFDEITAISVASLTLLATGGAYLASMGLRRLWNLLPGGGSKLLGVLLTFIGGLLLIAAAIAPMGIERVPVWFLYCGIALGIVNVTFYHLMRAPTVLGKQVMDAIDGFKLYLSVAEAERMNMDDAPDVTADVFEKFLPYAIGLGVEKPWSSAFESQMAKAAEQRTAYQPQWYHSSSAWDSGRLAAATTGIVGAVSAGMATASPPSSSGSGGGGSSGGGGGGGGGGGW